MIPMPSGVRVWIAAGHTDMRRGMQGLALQVQEQLKRDPHGGDRPIFRGRRGDLAKILWHDGLGLGSALPDDVAALKAALTAERARGRLEVAADLAVARARASEDMALIGATSCGSPSSSGWSTGSGRSARRLIDQLALDFEELEARRKTNWRRSRRPP